jgi:hypothetical protein
MHAAVFKPLSDNHPTSYQPAAYSLQLVRRYHQAIKAWYGIRSISTSPTSKVFKSIGLRREDKNRWERRVALTPNHVEQLVKEMGIKVYVQPSHRRAFKDWQYIKASHRIHYSMLLLTIC